MSEDTESVAYLYSDILSVAIKHFYFDEDYGLHLGAKHYEEKTYKLIDLIYYIPENDLYDLFGLERSFHDGNDLADILNVWMHTAPEMLPEIILNEVAVHTKDLWEIENFSCRELNDKQNIINKLESIQENIQNILSKLR
jgi:hypothetical protein